MILEFASKIITASPRLAVSASASFIPLFSNATNFSDRLKKNVAKINELAVTTNH
jgi:hypothetical protein